MEPSRVSIPREREGSLTGRLETLRQTFRRELENVSGEQGLLQIKSRYLGRQGLVTEAIRQISVLPPEERPVLGARINQVKKEMEQECEEALVRLHQARRAEQLDAERIDITLAGRSIPRGTLHPVTQSLREVGEIFLRIGFSIFEGPEVESDFYNFEALNIPPYHPAREMQDTFYVDSKKGTLLRTHTSPVQIRVMKNHRPPIRMIAPGVVYRRDSDISHTPVFHQVEGLAVDTDIRFSDLKGTVEAFLREFFQQKIQVRFRPSYFPFTEPSAEVDIGCLFCRQGKGRQRCRLCKGSGWLEIMGCGMVHPNVFRKVRYDVKKVTGFAFGVGIERLIMLRHEVPDIRLFFENDLRFLRQFPS